MEHPENITNCSLYEVPPTLKISWKSVQSFFRFSDRQTDKATDNDENITLTMEVVIIMTANVPLPPESTVFSNSYESCCLLTVTKQITYTHTYMHASILNVVQFSLCLDTGRGFRIEWRPVGFFCQGQDSNPSVSGTLSPADWMPAHKPSELYRLAVDLTPPPESDHHWLWRCKKKKCCVI